MSFRLPDLISFCDFPPKRHPNGETIGAASDKWIDESSPDLAPEQRAKLYQLHAGTLTAFCYPSCDDARFRVVCDYVNFLFHMDNISDGLMKSDVDALKNLVMHALWFPNDPNAPNKEISAARVARDFWTRCIQDAGPGMQARFKEHLQLFFEAVSKQAQDQDDGVILDAESYIAVRRNLGACKVFFDMVEYAYKIDLPEFVVEHPIIKALNDGANDAICLANDIVSFNVEQARGETFNIVIISIVHQKMTVQEAINYAGDIVKNIIETFRENRKKIPSFGSPDLDSDVEKYVEGLQDCIFGSIHGSFTSERYFGKESAEVKRHLTVKLLPKKQDVN